METIGERIRRLREARGLSPADLAHAVGITPQAIAAIENGDTKCPKLPNALLIARALNISAWEIAFGKPEPRRPLHTKAESEDALTALLAQMPAFGTLLQTEHHEERLARLEHSAAVHDEALRHIIDITLALNSLPDLLQRLALLVPGSGTLAEEIHTLRVSA
jgi:transcriptional regulator with XRE-family HTH domain